ncbi:homocysteine S-methyltransferase family protein [Lachnospiraceae bacterium MD1]|jgi:S-methylmethionine-dependent homocysteine/selenocysteine methylase|uniref:Homocysteine S-methyltransferase family protein n=1 Tax=Variimorphobacter saccharofermentans TaxID=2755051 RepID=A0A839K1H6_9FIRM|nr:homocysteine S-methyltransferase family protein [Variimorphobacter saccharofermentans]MBB2183763.1 homocysteine S-methyltransferase family protein [Variimorphobacter saccharofermentans]
MSFVDCIEQHASILMEGALGERLKREYHLDFDKDVALAKMIYNTDGASALKAIWQEYITIARKYNLPFLATTPTRRANRERVEKAGCDSSIILDNASFLQNIQKESDVEMYVGGLLGCKGDAYTGEGALSTKEAIEFHKWQVDLFHKANVDFLYAGIMPALPEIIGMAHVISDTGIPYIISFTIQKDGKLIDGTRISDAIQEIDSQTENKPICYMTNCVHPNILYEALSQPYNRNDVVQSRFLGIQANTSPLSYAELDNSTDLKSSEPEALAEDMIRLRTISNIKIFGGCCGTDHRHMDHIARRL